MAQPLDVREIYDLFMSIHEPELMTDVIPTLGDTYESETEEQWQERAERYEKAFQLFQERFLNFLDGWKSALLARKTEAISNSKTKVGAQELVKLRELEQLFQDQ